MIILHIAYLDENIYAGVNVAATRHILEQQREKQVGLLNIANTEIKEVANVFTISKNKCIDELPIPFNEPDIVIFHEIYRPIYLKLYKELLEKKIPYVIFPHGGLTKQAQSQKRIKKIVANKLLFNSFFNHAVSIQCLSKREMETSISNAEKFIGTNGIDEKNQIKKNLKTTELKFVYIGRIDFRIKGFDLLIEAIHREYKFLQENNCRFEIYGPSEGKSKKKIESLIRKKKIENIITLHEAVTKQKKEAALLDADYFIQTSRSEGMSMGILEALSYGIPCIVTEGTGMADEVEKNGAGIGCKTNAADIANALHCAVKKKELMQNMSNAAKEYVEKKYNWETITKNVINKYESVINSKNGKL